MTSVIIPCEGGEARGLERTRFYAQQLVGPDDLTQDQRYFGEKLRRHNRLLHGWGVVCGARVRAGATACELLIEPGFILGPFGDEIVLDRVVSFDVCKQSGSEVSGCCGDDLDPWCGEVHEDCAEGTRYLAVRYKECLSRPVRSPGGGCGCGCSDDACEYSRIRDGYAIALLRDLPASYVPFQSPNFQSLLEHCLGGNARACPPCPKDPWVILADVMIGSDCKVRGFDCFRHRRYVLSFAEFFLTCPPKTEAPGNPYLNVYGQPAMQPLRLGLERLLDAKGLRQLDEQHAGALENATKLQVGMLSREEGIAALPASVRKVPIGEVAEMPQETFVARAVEGTSRKKRAGATTAALAAWLRAREVKKAVGDS